jgi:2-polyprenyl-6-methoxyphenol hydroxylase-like FAD-dependent oxidoreductase
MGDRNLESSRIWGTHAIVIGGSIAGLLSARVLADYFSCVTIIERDKFSPHPEARQGVPQSVQPHILLTKGYRILETLFPGIGNRLSENGALKVDWIREFYNFSETEGETKFKTASEIGFSELYSFTCSRPLLEWTIRQQLVQFSNIKIIEGYRVTGLLCHSKQKVTGVKMRSRHDKCENQLSADLVVDASGRSSQAPQWLKDIGLTPPPETIVNPLLGYVSRRYREPKNFQANWKVMLISQSPPQQTRLGYLSRIENGEWIATLGGYSGDYPPTQEKSFLQFSRSLASSQFYEAISQAEPISELYAHRATTNRLRHFERIKMPQGFIVVGDAVCALCPIYGQGMTVSALAAMVLQNHLKKSERLSPKSNAMTREPRHKKPFSSLSFQKSLSKEIIFPWSFATMQDLRFPATKGERKENLFGKIMQPYTKKLLTKAKSDLSIYTLMIEVFHLLRSPIALYHPSVILKVMSN